MARIFLSYSSKDHEIAKKISDGLKAHGHEIVVEPGSLSPGQNWREYLFDSLKNSDGVIVLLTSNSLSSQFVLSEVGTARTFVNSSDKKFFIPVVIGNIEIPEIVNDILVLRADEGSMDLTITQLDHAIMMSQAKLASEESKKQEVFSRIEHQSTVYIEDALKALAKRELTNKVVAMACYALGFITLILGILYTYNSFQSVADLSNVAIEQLVFLGAKSLVILALLMVCCKYCVNLGKDFMDESLKNADRMHAISFGKFYLHAFGDKVSWEELKEVFQHWNITNTSSFNTIDVNQLDPKIVESLTQLSNLVPKK